MLAFDARWAVGPYRGMGRYTHALLQPISSKVHALLPSGAPGSAFPAHHYGWGFFPYWEQHVLPKICQELNVANLLCPYNTAPVHLPQATRLFLVVHDLIFLESWHRLPPSPSPYQTLGRIYRRQIVPRVIPKAFQLITVSRYTQKLIHDQFDIPLKEIRIIPNSIPDDWIAPGPLPEGDRLPYFFTVAGEAPSKNLTRLLKAFAHYKQFTRSQVKLVVAGVKPACHDKFIAVAREMNIEQSLELKPRIDDQELRMLYRYARLFVMPSLYEGFGIPLLEAMASATPIACSNTASLPEVTNGNAWFFNPRDILSISQALVDANSLTTQRSEFISHGLEQAQRHACSAIQHEIKSFWSAHAL